MWPILLLILSGLSVFLGSPATDYEAAIRTYRENKLDSARFHVDRAIAHYQAEGKTDSIVLSRVQKALIIWEVEGLDAAFRSMDSTLKMAEQLPVRHAGRVAAYSRMGQLHMYRHEFRSAVDFFYHAENAIAQQKDPHTVALYNHMAVMSLMQEDYPSARRHIDRAYALNMEVEGPDGATMPMILQTRFFISRYSEDFKQALQDGEEYQRVTRLHYPPNHPRMGTMHNSLAVIHETLRQYDEAMVHRRMAVDIHSQAYSLSGDSFSLASAYQNIGYLYGYLNEPFLAQEYLEKGSRLLERTYGTDGLGMVKPLADMAVHKYKAGKHAEATALFDRALRLQRQHAPDDLQGLAYVEGFQADMFLGQQAFEEAVTLFNIVLERYIQAGAGSSENALLTRFGLAQALAGLNRFDEAVEMEDPILDGFRTLYPVGNDAIAYKLSGFSGIYLKKGDLGQAYALSDRVFSELMLREELPRDYSEWFALLPFHYHTTLYVGQRAEILFQLFEDSQDRELLEHLLELVREYSRFVADHLHVFRSQASLVDLADANKQVFSLAMDAAWELSNQGKTTKYNELAFSYAERSKALLMRLTANNMLLDSERKDDAEVDNKQKDQTFRQRIGSLNAQYLNSNRSDSLLALLSTTMEDYRLFQDSLKKADNRLHTMRYSLDIPSPVEIEAGLLATGETLLEYAVTDRSVLIFVLGENTLRMCRANREVLEDVAYLREFHGLNPEEFAEPAYRLYQNLVQPIEKYALGKRLLIVPDGDLYYLNFEALVTGSHKQKFSRMPFLIHRYEISYLLSATSALQFKQVLNDQQKRDKALILTPVFTDEMKKNYRLSLPAQDATGEDYIYLLRQPFALQAAQRIANWVPHDLFFWQQAEERLFKQVASDYRILHLGTHAEINNYSPLHSRLYFAKAMFDDPTNTDDGYLYAYEVYSMQLGAEMAVLTACETGSGDWRNGEGVISLAHGFMHAGCPSVLMTLWKVDEQASNEVIAQFYKYLSKGYDKSKALRMAKLDLLATDNERLAHPYYWAGLSLVGDPVPLYDNKSRWFWIVAIIILLAGGALFLRKRKPFPSEN